MKRFAICSAVLLTVLAAGSVGFCADKGRRPGRHQRAMKQARTVQDANLPNASAVKDPNRAARRGRRLGNLWLKRIKSLKAIRQIASKEGATKTVAALDKLIAKEKKQRERMLESTALRRGNRRGPAGAHAGRRFMRHGRRTWHRGPRPPRDVPEAAEEQ